MVQRLADAKQMVGATGTGGGGAAGAGGAACGASEGGAGGGGCGGPAAHRGRLSEARSFSRRTSSAAAGKDVPPGSAGVRSPRVSRTLAQQVLLPTADEADGPDDRSLSPERLEVEVEAAAGSQAERDEESAILFFDVTDTAPSADVAADDVNVASASRRGPPSAQERRGYSAFQLPAGKAAALAAEGRSRPSTASSYQSVSRPGSAAVCLRPGSAAVPVPLTARVSRPPSAGRGGGALPPSRGGYIRTR